jgi:hypothetical protein
MIIGVKLRIGKGFTRQVVIRTGMSITGLPVESCDGKEYLCSSLVIHAWEELKDWGRGESRSYYMFRGGNYECRSGRLRGMWERIITDYNMFRVEITNAEARDYAACGKG